MVGLIGTEIVSGQQAGERGLLPRAFVIEWVHVIDVTARRRLRLLPGTDGDDLHLRADDAIRIGEHEPALIYRIRLEIQNTAREHVRGKVAVEMLSVAVARQATGH